MPQVRKSRSKISLFPTDHKVKTARSKLPVFEAHDLRSLISEAKTNDKVDFDSAFLFAFRRRNDTQMQDLLRHLGVDPSKSDAWLRGFFHLAVLHHGVGHLAWYPRRTNRNSATWTLTHDVALLCEVGALKEQGFSERRAINKLAADPKKRQLYPYRMRGHFSTGREQQKREDALRARLQKLKSSPRGEGLARALGLHRWDLRSTELSSTENALYDLDRLNSLPDNVVKNQSRSRGAHS
jgi:hypothetical protein